MIDILFFNQDGFTINLEEDFALEGEGGLAILVGETLHQFEEFFGTEPYDLVRRGVGFLVYQSAIDPSFSPVKKGAVIDLLYVVDRNYLH